MSIKYTNFPSNYGQWTETGRMWHVPFLKNFMTSIWCHAGYLEPALDMHLRRLVPGQKQAQTPAKTGTPVTKLVSPSLLFLGKPHVWTVPGRCDPVYVWASGRPGIVRNNPDDDCRVLEIWCDKKSSSPQKCWLASVRVPLITNFIQWSLSVCKSCSSLLPLYRAIAELRLPPRLCSVSAGNLYPSLPFVQIFPHTVHEFPVFTGIKTDAPADISAAFWIQVQMTFKTIAW